MSIRTPLGTTGVPGRPLVSRGARALAALALSAASGIHLARALGHLPDRSVHGRLHLAFFVAAALFQAVTARALFADRLRRPVPVAAANVGLAAVWVAAVSIGLPEWLAPVSPEPVTVAGSAAAAAEIVAAYAVLDARARPYGERSLAEQGPMRVPPRFAVAGLALLAVGWTLPASTASHHHAGPGAHHGQSDHYGAVLHGLGGDPADPGPDPGRQRRGRLAGTRLAVGRAPAAIAVDHGLVWVADREAGLVHRLDATTGRRLGPPSVVPAHPSGVAVGEGAAWVTSSGSDLVSRIDPATGQTLATMPVGRVPVGVAVGGGSVWVANSAEGTVSRIDPRTGGVDTTPRIGYGPTAITVAAGRVWVVASLDRAVVSLDLDTATVLSTTPVCAGATSVAFGHGSLWVASSSAGTVTRIDAVTAAPLGAPLVVDRQVQPGQGPAALAVGARVWVLNNHDKTVVSIDPSTRAVSRPQFLARRVARHIVPASAALSEAGDLWATDHDAGVVVRLQPRKELL